MIKNVLFPKLNNFSEKLDAFIDDLANMRYSVAEFDRSLCTKASKS
jgi:hypothetical protein